MNVPTPEQTAKLPKWAKDYIAALERRYSEAKTELKDYLDSKSESRAYLQQPMEQKCWLQDDRVNFTFKNGEIRALVNGEELEVSATYGLCELAIFPQSSNVVIVRIQERRPKQRGNEIYR